MALGSEGADTHRVRFSSPPPSPSAEPKANRKTKIDGPLLSLIVRSCRCRCHGDQDILAVLGDQEDTALPIFHDRKDQSGDATITTMLFNVAARTATQYRGNPKNGNIRKIYPLTTPSHDITPSHPPV